jgi:hypothetical protein
MSRKQSGILPHRPVPGNKQRWPDAKANGTCLVAETGAAFSAPLTAPTA